MRLTHVKTAILALLVLSVLGTIGVLQLPEVKAQAIGWHRVTAEFYGADIWDDHDSGLAGAGEWTFSLYWPEKKTAEISINDGAHAVFYLSNSWIISDSIDYICEACEWDPLGLDYWGAILVHVPFPGPLVNMWHEVKYSSYDRDVTFYSRYYIQNGAPSISLLLGPSSGYRGVPYTFTTTGSDPELDSINYLWLVDGFIAATGPALTYTFPTSATVGTHEISVRAVDAFGAGSDFTTKTFTIYNRAPTVGKIKGPSSGNPGIAYLYSTSGSDPDGDPVTYEWGVKSPKSFSFVTQPVTGSDLKFTFGGVGVWTIGVRAKDSMGLYSASAFKDVTITTAKLDTQIAFSFSPNPANPNQQVTLSGTLKTVGGSAIYPATVTIDYSNNGGATWNPLTNLNTNSAGQFSVSFPAPGAGSYLARVSYTGSTTYNPSSKTETLVVQTGGKVDTAIVFSFSPNPASPGQTVTLSGTLKTATANPVYPAQVAVEYSTNGVTWSFFTNLNTNAAGQFSASFGAPGIGTYLVRVSYAGSTTFNPGSSTQTLTVS